MPLLPTVALARYLGGCISSLIGEEVAETPPPYPTHEGPAGWGTLPLKAGSLPPPGPDPNARQATGAFRLDVKSGRVSTVKKGHPKEGELPDWTPGPTKRDGWVFRVEEKSPKPAYPHVLTTRMLIAEREDRKESWKRPLVGQPYLPPRP